MILTRASGESPSPTTAPNALPDGFAPGEFQQFRFRRERGRVIVQIGAAVVCEVAAAKESGSISIAAGVSPIALDLVRLTAIKTP
jgi:hypothetical protein